MFPIISKQKKNREKSLLSLLDKLRDPEYIANHKAQYVIYMVVSFLLEFLFFLTLAFVFGCIGAELRLLGGLLF